MKLINFIKNLSPVVIMWLLIILLLANLTTAGFLIYHNRPTAIRSFKNPYPLIDPSRSFTQQSDYIVNIQPLREKLRDIAKEYGDDSISIYIEFLNTGGNISINPETYIWPASLAKVPLALAVMKKIEDGDWTLTNELVLMPGDADEKSGDLDNPLSEYPIGTRFTIEKLLKELLVKSDNTAYYILLRNLHQDDLKKVIESLGMESLFTPEGKVSAKEYSRILRSLYTASFLKRENSTYILNLLDEATFDDFLFQAIPSNISFAHKYGENLSLMTFSDSGIVYLSNRPYIISVMLQGNASGDQTKEKERAAQFMKRISQETFNYFSAF